MKKLLLSTVLIAFAMVAVQADDAKATAKTAQDKPACCAKKATSEVKAECPMAKQKQAKAECPKASQAKAGSCPMAKQACHDAMAKCPVGKRIALLSPKALDTVTR